jgi:hypothetical protein
VRVDINIEVDTRNRGKLEAVSILILQTEYKGIFKPGTDFKIRRAS